jgi:peptidoglycan/LPS O-acetylase OafA/YrhL
MWGGRSPEFVAPFLPSWSVAIEEQFYLAWPLLLSLVGRRCVMPVACALLVTSTIYQCAGGPTNTLLCRGDGLAAGCLLAAFIDHPARDRVVTILRALLIGGLAVVLCAPLLWHDPAMPPAPLRAVLLKAFAALFAGGVGLSVRFSGHAWLAPLRWRGAVLLGLISYSLYMLHVPLFNWMPVILARAGVTSPSLRQALVWVSVFGVPACSYVLVERPILSLKRLINYA